MKRHILILEDLEISRQALAKMVQECGDELEIHAFGDLASAMACAVEEKIDIFLVDIVLKPKEPNDFSGITFAKTVRELDKYSAAEIIFITTLAGLEAKLLRTIHCFDYIEKPIAKERVQKMIRDVLRKLDGKPVERAFVLVRKDHIVYSFYEDTIIYLEYRRRKLYIHTDEEVFDVPYQSIKDLLKRIQTQTFLYTSKSIAVNVAYIKYVDATNRYVKLHKIKELVELSNRKKDSFLEEWQRLEGKGKS